MFRFTLHKWRSEVNSVCWLLSALVAVTTQLGTIASGLIMAVLHLSFILSGHDNGLEIPISLVLGYAICIVGLRILLWLLIRYWEKYGMSGKTT